MAAPTQGTESGAQKSGGPIPSLTGPAPSESPFDSRQILAFKESQDLLKKRLNPTVLALFEKLLGQPLQVTWSEPVAIGSISGAGTAGGCPHVERNSPNPVKKVSECEECLAEHWRQEDVSEEALRGFIGRCGLDTVVGTVQLASRPLVQLVAQGRVKSRAANRFKQVEALLDLLVHDLRSSLRLRMAEWEREALQRRLERAESELGCPVVSPESLGGGPLEAVAAGKVVRSMLDYVRDHYHQPMGLKDIAKDLRMNANYLSGLFHRATGITFHHYLDARRMTKAEELLRDPHIRIAEVARAVGYTNPNHFRKVFKAREKVSPRAWVARQH